MRRLVAALILLTFPLAATAQVITPPAASFAAIAGWQKLAALSPGTPIYVYAQNKKTTHCALENLTADTLVCLNGMGTLTFQKADVLKVKRAHKTRSSWVGFAIGYVIADGLVVAVDRGNESTTKAGTLAVIAILALVAGPVIGHITDFTRNTVYTTQP